MVGMCDSPRRCKQAGGSPLQYKRWAAHLKEKGVDPLANGLDPSANDC